MVNVHRPLALAAQVTTAHAQTKVDFNKSILATTHVGQTLPIRSKVTCHAAVVKSEHRPKSPLQPFQLHLK